VVSESEATRPELVWVIVAVAALTPIIGRPLANTSARIIIAVGAARAR